MARFSYLNHERILSIIQNSVTQSLIIGVLITVHSTWFIPKQSYLVQKS